MSAYLELEAQPAIKRGYTARLDMVRKTRRPKFRSAIAYGIGRTAHIVKDKARAMVGAIRKRRGEAVVGLIASFVKSFIPSAKG